MKPLPYTRCDFFPVGIECVCSAGSDVSAVNDDDFICSEEYSASCPWYKERQEDILLNERTKQNA